MLGDETASLYGANLQWKLPDVATRQDVMIKKIEVVLRFSPLLVAFHPGSPNFTFAFMPPSVHMIAVALIYSCPFCGLAIDWPLTQRCCYTRT